MAGFLEVLRFELRYQWRSPLFLALAGFFFLMTFFAMASDSVTIGGGADAVNLNAPYIIVQTQMVFSFIGMFAAIAFVATAITRDYEHKTAELFFTSGVSEPQFLLGRFFGGAVFAVLVGCAAMLGTMVGELMPWLDAERLGAFTLAPYGYSLLWVVIPNYLLCCALFFAAAALARSVGAAYMAALAFMVVYVAAGYFADPDQIELWALLDPLGTTAFAEQTRYWTVFERNSELPAGSMFANRAIWLSVAAVALLLTALAYRFRLGGSGRAAKKDKVIAPAPAAKFLSVAPTFGRGQAVSQFLQQLRMDVSGVVRSAPFYVILLLGIFNVLGGFEGTINSRYGTPVYPVTALALNVIAGAFMFIVLIIVLYFSGELVHRERQYKLAEIVDATPYPNVTMVLAKVGALWFVIACLLLVVMVTSMIMQALNGYTNFEVGLYLKGLFAVLGVDFFLIAVLAVFVQVLLPNKWFGLFGMVLVFIVMQTLPSLGFQHNLYLFNTPGAPYSDMNGYGHFAEPVTWFALYWAAISLVLMVLAHLFYVRGTNSGWSGRWATARARLTGPTQMVGAAGLVAAAVLGGYIFYNTNVLNDFRTDEELEQRAADYEKQFKPLEDMPLPQVVSIDSAVDIYPDSRSLASRGAAHMVNQTLEPIAEFPVSLNPELDVGAMAASGAELDTSHADIGHYMVRFAEPLAPGEATELTWDLVWANPGFRNHNANNRVVENGTFVNNTEILPVPGYDSSRELQDNNLRREYDLPPVERLPKLGNKASYAHNQMGVSSRSAFRAVMSTATDQIAIAPGYLKREWEEGGRRYFEYEMDDPIWPFLSFISARYAVKRDVWNDVDLEVYYHPQHDYNVDRMIEASKRSLDYFSTAFSPYQYRQFRILEFPGYATFAQAFPNTIPYSERIGFVADLTDPKDIDYVFYVTAHEMAHQWWAHQVIGARMQGMTLIVETLAQYSALMVMEKAYGREKMRRFLKHELDRYLSSRGGELIEELPLKLVENQGYIHYRKGSLVMYALREAIGEEKVNLALRRFIEQYGFKEAPYPSSQDLIDEFRAVAGDEHQALITDLFDRITVYDLRLAEAEVAASEDGYEVSITVDASKFYADGAGQTEEAALDTWVEVGLYPERTDELSDDDLPAPLSLTRLPIRSGSNELTLRSVELPDRVVVDPYLFLIDRDPGDNGKRLAL